MAGASRSYLMVMISLVIISLSLKAKRVEAQVHHVVGGDQGWDPSSNVNSWSSGRVYRVGDQIWFMYSAAEGSVAEVKSKDEYDSCDVSNPIRLYTDGLDTVPLHGEGSRYFTSSRSEHCKDGLKLHVNVVPQVQAETENPKKSETTTVAVATGPTPSASAQLPGVASLIWVVVVALLCQMGL